MPIGVVISKNVDDVIRIVAVSHRYGAPILACGCDISLAGQGSFFAGTISDEWRQAHFACMRAQDAALKVIRDGASARDADGAARSVMQQAGFGAAFKHGLGHGFGFQAINHAAAPVLHPASNAVLHSGMVHNMEPAIYLEGKGGIRLNDNVAVQQDGNEVLSASLPPDLDWLVVEG